MIDLNVYSSELDTLLRGDTVSVCHENCPAGEDTRYRLYLTKPAGSPNVVLGYCHNCNESGVLRDADDTPYRDFNGHAQPLVKQIQFDVPDNMIPCGDRWPAPAHAWRIQKGLSTKICNDFDIQYDPATHRVFLPIYRNIDPLPSGLVGYQLRQLDGKAPKYLTAQVNQDTILYTVMRPYSQHTTDYVLVEDFASGIAIYEAIESQPTVASHIGILVNYGVKTKVEALNDCPHIESGYVWLDNDSQHILDQSTRIAKTWRLVTGREIRQNLTCADPKQYSNDGILDTFKEAGLW